MLVECSLNLNIAISIYSVLSNDFNVVFRVQVGDFVGVQYQRKRSTTVYIGKVIMYLILNSTYLCLKHFNTQNI